MGGRCVVLLVGCSELSSTVMAAGYDVEVAEYFWGCLDAEVATWRAAIVRMGVGGGTGLLVAERLVDRGVVPLLLYGPGERFRVEPRFVGVPARTGEVPEGLPLIIEECVRMSRALRIDEPTTEISIRDSMILRAESVGL